MRTKATSLLFALVITHTCLCQPFKAFNNNITDHLIAEGKNHDLFKFSWFLRPDGSGAIGLSFGMWREHPVFQYSLNTAGMLRFGKRFLGNYRNGGKPDDKRTKSQFVFSFTPMLSINLWGKEYKYQELEPFYFGSPNAVFCKYRNHVTLGSTFTISPRGTYHNVTTIRNRTQQVFMFALNFKNFNFTLYDDYFPFFTDKLQLGDNYDRFFTGGGFLRYRFSDEFTLRAYSEVYTGINRANGFLYPDIISYQPISRKRWRLKNFANQNAGQEFFNSSWFFFKLNYTNQKPINSSTGIYCPDISVFLGSKAPWTMFSQNVIHSTFKYDRQNDLKLHYFLPRPRVPGNLEAAGKSVLGQNFRALFIGGGIEYNIK